MQQTWAAGDFSMIATGATIVGELLCESADVRSGQTVLDVATGSGNTALAAARRRCDVTGIDFVPALLERARERAAVERLEATFQEGDAENIPFPDGSFHFVLSTFGVMFAPDHQKAADEMLRVCHPGGTIGVASWTPEGFIGTIERTASRYVPPPPEMKSPLLWGTEAHVRDLFGNRITTLRVTRRTCVFRARSVPEWLNFNRRFLGHVIKTFEKLDPAKQETLMFELTEVGKRFNRSGDETMVAPAEYLEIVATR
jgi:ubiquinone/menaquinone biosynthesis C-methylase UbiE